jgi:tetratricopeptide (TPR) repeat protein
MWGWHPSREQLDRHVRDELPLPQRRRVTRHLSACPLCQRRENRLSSEVSLSIPVSYDGAIQRASLEAARWLKRLENESHHAKELLAELLRDSGPEPLERLRQAPPALSLKLLRLLQERCRSSWFQEPVRAVELAQLEVCVAERLDESRCGSGVAADSRAWAWADLGNTHRILSDFKATELALGKAFEHQRLSGDPLTECKILSLQASLCKGQGRFDESFSLWDRVLQIAREAEDRHREGQALIAKGTTASEQAIVERGSFRESIRLLRKGLARLDAEADPKLLLAVRHNILINLTEAGRPHDAEQILVQERHRYDCLGSEVFLAKLRWLEGSIDEGLGRWPQAETSLRSARDLLQQQQRKLESAFVSLQLSIFLCKQGRRGDALRLVEEIIPVFESVYNRPAETAARLLLRRLRS